MVFRCICLGVALFATACIPWLLLVNARYLTPRCVRAACARAYAYGRRILRSPKGAHRA